MTHEELIEVETEILKFTAGRGRNRQRARLRDNLTCQKCGVVWVWGTRRFDIHHLDGVCGKKSRGYDKTVEGLITYCHKCHLNLHEVRTKMSRGRHDVTSVEELVESYQQANTCVDESVV